MKKVLLMLAITASTIGAKAQNGRIPVGGYGAGTSEITWVNGKPALNVGAYGGVLINHKFLIGAAGSNIFFDQTLNGKKEKFQLNYYGLYTEYRILPSKPVNISLGLTSALGWHENSILTDQKTNRRDGDLTYVFQPKVGVNVKIAKFMQAQLYGSYRITGDTKSQYFTQSNTNGFSAGAALVFGSF
jgi:hypothetical protein